jgi:hypothetical protein
MLEETQPTLPMVLFWCRFGKPDLSRGAFAAILDAGFDGNEMELILVLLPPLSTSCTNVGLGVGLDG